MHDRSTSLSYAVRLPVLAKYLGQLALMLAMLTTVLLGVALLFQDFTIAFRYFLVVAVLIIGWQLSRKIPEPRQIQANEALTIIALAFVISPLLMTFPLMSSGLTFSNALFEAVSAVTTTGLSTTTDLADRSASFLFARAWLQWYGGLGIVVLSVALVMEHHVTSRSLSEPLGGDTLATTTRIHSRRMLIVYGVMTLIGMVGVWLISGDGLMAVTHVLAAVSTGGFSMFENSLGGLPDWSSRFAIISLCLCGAVPLPLYHVLCSKNWRTGLRDVELLALLSAVLLLASILTLTLHYSNGIQFRESVLHALLLGISTQTTAGFSSLDIGTLDNGTRFCMILSMFIGGGVGSTAGGIKLIRLLILLKLIQVLLQRSTMPPQAVQYPKLGGRVLEDAEIQRVLLLILLFIGVVAGSWLAFLGYGYEPLDALFEVVSATATVGLSTGITSGDMPLFLKLLLSLDMLLGRLEIIALLVLMYARNWAGKRKEVE
ncbi:MAG: potassium transporter TrkG [Gammaproteobacteria bacterium]